MPEGNSEDILKQARAAARLAVELKLAAHGMRILAASAPSEKAFAKSIGGIENYKKIFTNIVDTTSAQFKASQLSMVRSAQLAIREIGGIKNKQAAAEIALFKDFGGEAIGHANRLAQIRKIPAKTAEGAAAKERAIAKEQQSYSLKLGAELGNRKATLALAGIEAGKREATGAVKSAMESNNLISGAILRRSDFMAGVMEKEKKISAGEPGAKYTFMESSAAGLMKMAAPILTALEGLSAVGIAAKLLMLAFQGLEQGRKLGGKALVAMSMDGAKLEDSLLGVNIQALATGRDVMTAFAGSMGYAGKEFVGLAALGVQTGMSLSDDLMIPAVDAVISMRQRIGEEVPKSAAYMAKMGLAGIDVGMDLQTSFKNSSMIGKAFNLTMEKTEPVARSQRNAIRNLGLSYEDLSQAMGDIIQLGRAFGNQAGIYDSMRQRMALHAEALGPERTKMMAGAIMGFANAPMARMIGMRMAFGGGSLDESLAAFERTGQKGGNVADFAMSTMGMATSTTGKMGEMARALRSGNRQDRMRGAMFFGQQFGGENPDAMMKALFTSEDVRKAFTGESGLDSKKRKEVIERGVEQYDSAMRGARLQQTQADILGQILARSQDTVRILGMMLSGWAAKLFSNPEAEAMGRAMSAGGGSDRQSTADIVSGMAGGGR